VLREANSAATAGDWGRVAAYVDPLLVRQLDATDLAEAHRLAGLAAYFQNRRGDAEFHFLAYLKSDLDAHLDPALYPPEVVRFFDDVRANHAAELRARRPKSKRYMILNFLPPFGQLQNGDSTKGIVISGLLGAFALTNVTSLLLVRSWCTQVTGPGGQSYSCEDQHVHGAGTARGLIILSGAGLLFTYVYGVYDGVSKYRRQTREQSFAPFATPTNTGALVGVMGSF
jgi:hypothetical protein